MINTRGSRIDNAGAVDVPRTDTSTLPPCRVAQASVGHRNNGTRGVGAVSTRARGGSYLCTSEQQKVEASMLMGSKGVDMDVLLGSAQVRLWCARALFALGFGELAANRRESATNPV